MKVSELLSKEIDPAKIHSPRIRNEVETLLDLARLGLGLANPTEMGVRISLEKAPRRRPYVDKILLLNISRANAFAFATGVTSTIAITVGVPLIARALFIAALADDRVLNDLPDVHYLRVPYKSMTQCDWKRLADLLSAFSFDKFEAWAQSAPILPQTADYSGRGDLAIILSMQAWSFIVFHELGHHAMQHLGAPEAGSAGVAYTEIEDLVPGINSSTEPLDRIILQPGNADLPKALLLRHANELEADRYAIAKMYGGFFRSHPAVTLKAPNYIKMTAMSERSRTRLWLVTIGIVFLLFEVTGRRRAANTHPRPLFRLQHLREFTRSQARAVIPAASTREFDRGYADATRDLMIIAQNLGIRDLYAGQPGGDAYKDRMMEIRASRVRIFKDDASK